MPSEETGEGQGRSDDSAFHREVSIGKRVATLSDPGGTVAVAASGFSCMLRSICGSLSEGAHTEQRFRTEIFHLKRKEEKKKGTEGKENKSCGFLAIFPHFFYDSTPRFDLPASRSLPVNSSCQMDDAYEMLIRRMNSPRIVINNESCSNATAIRVVSSNKHGRLLEVVQALTDLNLVVTKAYMSSDGVWFMDVFYVTDRDGKKLQDVATDRIMDYLKKSLAAEVCFAPYIRESSVGVAAYSDYTSVELSGTDRPGLLSDVSAVLTNLGCNVVGGEVWTHNRRAAAVIYVTEEASGMAITDSKKLSMIEQLLYNLLKGNTNNYGQGARTMVSCGTIHAERRLHQMMFADRDYERSDHGPMEERLKPNVTIANRCDKDYSVVTIRCKDRPKLLFDTVCTLTDMQYVVFHGNVDAGGAEAYQEYYIRHIDGSPLSSEAEKHRVIQCLEAAIERRVYEDLKLELCTSDSIGLLSHVTRIFRENGLSVTRAEVSTRGGKAINTFYVRDASGHGVDSKMIDAVREAIGMTIIQVKDDQKHIESSQEPLTRSLFGGLFKSRSFCNFSLIRP